MDTVSHAEFLREYAEALNTNSAAAFVGAGLSVGAGFVNWRDLLREIATDLGLEIDQEHDLIAVAQYKYNQRGREPLNKAILNHFVNQAQLTESHRLLARLPLDTVWTTNYDHLLEDAFRHAHRVVDVKRRVPQLKHRVPYADVTIFKMHGDVEDPEEAVLTKDDYERYELDRAAYTNQLQSDLLSRTVLFVGFSFTDPNIEYTFNRLRRMLDSTHTSSNAHFCILRCPQREDYDADRKFEVESKRFEHRVGDLKRFGVGVVAIRSYGEVEELLRKLNRRVNSRSVMISGTAHDFSPWGRERLEGFCRALGGRLIREGHNLVSGFGLGISAAILVGAHEQLAREGSGRLGQRLRLYPFPVGWKNEAEKRAFYEDNRREMASQAGVTIFISGNKLSDGAVISSPGMEDEYQQAVLHDHLLVPVGATGHAAREFHKRVVGDKEASYKRLGIFDDLLLIGRETESESSIIDAIVRMIKKHRETV